MFLEYSTSASRVSLSTHTHTTHILIQIHMDTYTQAHIPHRHILSLSLSLSHTHTHIHTHTRLANPRVKSTTDRSQTPCHTQHCLTHTGGAQDPGEGSLPGHIFLRSQIDPFKGKICFQILESLVTFLLHCLKRISFRLTSVRNASRLKCLP